MTLDNPLKYNEIDKITLFINESDKLVYIYNLNGIKLKKGVEPESVLDLPLGI